MTHTERTSYLLAVFAVGIRLAFMLVTRFVADDAFITYRYAEMLGTGHGFVYNIGESVLGTTTPLYTMILSLATLAGLSIPIFSSCIALLASGFTAAILYRYALQLRLAEWAIVPAALYIIWPRSILADASGMETALFTLLLVTSGYWLVRKKNVYAAGYAALATLTRPEGGLFLVVLMLALFIGANQSKWKAAVIAAFPLVAWTIYATITFGSPFPSSVAGKLALYVGDLESTWSDRLVQIIGSDNPVACGLAFLVVIFAILGLRRLWQTQRHGELEAAWLLGTASLYLFFTPHIFFWYLAPLYPWLFVFLTAGVVSFLTRLSIARIARYVRPAFVIATVVLLCLPLLYRSWTYWREHQIAYEHIHRAIGEYLAVQVGKDEVVAAEDIGYIGYLSHARILDRDGLVSPVARSYNESGDYGGLLVDTHPDWAVIADSIARNAFVADSAFRAHYHEVEHFAYANLGYRVYRLRDTLAAAKSTTP